MKKRALALIMAAAMAGSLAACGGSQKTETAAATTAAAPAATEAATTAAPAAAEAATTAAPAAEDVKLTFAWWGNQVRNDRTQAALDLYTEKNPNITFDAQPVPWADYWAKLATAAAGNALPDLLQTNYTATLEQYADNNLLLDLGPYIESGLLDVSSIDPAILESGSVDGKLYAICCGLNVPAMIYNKTLTDELGIEIKQNMTVDEFMAVSREIYEKSGVKTDLAFGNATSMMDYQMRGEGTPDFFGDKAFNVESSEAFEPFFEIYEAGHNEGWMIDAGIYAELTLNSPEQAPLVYFSSPDTQSWCACFWSNQLTALQTAAPEGMELAYSTWPAADPVKADYLHPSMYFSVAAGSEHAEEAVKVLNYLINDVECNNILLAERGIPAAAAVANAIAPNLSEASQLEITFINDVVTPNSSTISPCPPVAATEIYNKADTLVEEVLYGVKTAKEAAASLYEQGNKILAEQ